MTDDEFGTDYGHPVTSGHDREPLARLPLVDLATDFTLPQAQEEGVTVGAEQANLGAGRQTQSRVARHADQGALRTDWAQRHAGAQLVIIK